MELEANWLMVSFPVGLVVGRSDYYHAKSHFVRTSFRIASWNVGTMRGRSGEIVETISRRGIDVCCLQETRWRGASARMITGKDSRYKFFWVGNANGTGGVGVLLAEKWLDKVFDIKRISDRIILIKLVVGDRVVSILSVYAPQVGLDDSFKDTFYENLLSVVSKLPDKEIVIPCGDWNGHIGRTAAGYEGVHGGFGYGDRNLEGERILEFAVANDLVVGNSFFQKRDSHLITYASGPSHSQIDFILMRKRDLKLVKDIKVIPSEECAPQHKLLVCDLNVKAPAYHSKPFTPKCRIWKLREPQAQAEFEQVFAEELNVDPAVEESIEDLG